MGLYDIFLITSQGDIVFTVTREEDYRTNLLTGPFKDTQLAQTFKQAMVLSAAELSAFEYYLPSHEIAAFIGVPIWEKGNLRGVVCTQISIKKIKDFAGNYKGLGETGEMVIATQKGDLVEIITPLRHDPTSAFKKKFKIDYHAALPIQLAVQAREGVGPSVDYRGKDIMAVWRYLSHPGWGMVVKINANEVFAPALKYKNLMVFIGIVTFLCVILVAILVSSSISRPVIGLTRATKVVAAGDLTSKINIKSADEIGQLANSFNTMVHSLKQAQEELVRKEKFAVIGRVSGSIAHDIRHPLTTIKNSSYFLNMKLKDPDEKTKKHLKLIDSEVTQANRIITALTRLSESKTSEKGRVNTNEYVKEFFAEYPLPEHIKLTVECDSEYSDIIADRLQLRQAFANITANAVHAMPEGGTLTVKTRVVQGEELGVGSKKEKGFELEGDLREISFADTGSGIKKEILDKIFDPFFSTGMSGMGLGLSIVKDIVASNDGNITVESEEGEGSTFKIMFPGLKDC